MSSLVFTVVPGSEITQEQLKGCADLFSNNYGVWSKQAQERSPSIKQG
jgi:hypothetical protein